MPEARKPKAPVTVNPPNSARQTSRKVPVAEQTPSIERLKSILRENDRKNAVNENRFRPILEGWRVEVADLDPEVEDPDSLKHVIGDAWLMEPRLEQLEGMAAENNGEISALSAEFVEK